MVTNAEIAEFARTLLDKADSMEQGALACIKQGVALFATDSAMNKAGVYRKIGNDLLAMTMESE